MNKLSKIAKRFAILLCVCLSTSAYSASDLELKVENLNSSVDMKLTADVKKQINKYTLLYREDTEIILGRVSLYFPLFEDVLREKGLPDDLKYLSIIESSLKPTATSRVGASGLWQFMKGTGRMMGLKITSTIDERRDPEKSTYAAAEYLSKLYQSFGDWTLAIAAYNCGPGNVRKAIRKSGGKRTYWEIQSYLPRETRHYIPKFIAATYLMNYYYEHDLVPIMPADELLNTAKAEVSQKVMLQRVSNTYNVNLATIQLLNPTYIRNIIPASADKQLTLKLPKHKMYEYVQDNYDSTTLLTPMDGSGSRKAIEITSLTPYTVYDEKEEHGVTIKVAQLSPTMVRPTRYRTTRLGIKESLADVADRTGTTVEQILQINGFDLDNIPTVGSVIKIDEI